MMNALKPISILVLTALAITGCGNKSETNKSASQVAVKVNSGEISVHQVNYVLQRTPGLKPEYLEEAKKQVVESLIDQELAVQQAIDAKLERDPNVLQSLETARREVLARAYLEQQVANSSKPAPEEVRKYFSSHPELFSGRKIYRLEEIAFSATPEVIAATREQLGKSKSMTEVVSFLKSKGVEPAGGIAVKPAEQIALEILPKLAQQKEGQPHMYEHGNQAVIMNVLATKSEPLSETQATPIIEQFLANQKKTEQARNVVKQLREKAKIEYVGEFAASRPAETAPSPVTKVEAKPQDQGGISKGIAGLK